MKTKLYKNVLNQKLLVCGLFLALVGQAGFANAEQAVTAVKAKKQEPLTVTLTAQKVQKDTKGKEVFLKADKVKPGDMVEYKAQYANVSKTELKNVFATLPVPKGMDYVDRTANPAAAMATLDGVKYDAVPLKRQVKDKTGKQVTVLVPVSEYKALRWSLGAINAGKVMTVSARVRVEQ
jgi:uncharacterized repeat protein (TIGR01451 family)